MKVARAKEILKSPETIEVTYQGKSVWIDGVEENSEMARIHTKNQPGEQNIVSVTELQER